jgi:esterase
MNKVLAHDRVTAENADPAQWCWFLAGIYGAGRNWASVARRFVRERTDWGAVLVDLRQHGASQGFTGPHTIAAAAADLDALSLEIGAPKAIVAHSFGGKVALEYARTHAASLEQLWIIDSTPAAREPSGSAWKMLDVIRSLPDSFPAREAAVAAMKEKGIETGTAQWMATNLEHRNGALHWRFDLDAMEELLRDFFRTDLWDTVEDPPAGVHIHFVRASESSVLDPANVERIEAAGRTNPRVSLHTLEGGHWLNADNPDGLHELFMRFL